VERGGRAMKPAVACNREKSLELQDFHARGTSKTPLFFNTIALIHFVYQYDSDYPFD